MGSLRYLYKYIEKNGAIEKLLEMGLSEGDTIRLFDYLYLLVRFFVNGHAVFRRLVNLRNG